MITYKDYCVAEPDALETPAMLLFQDMSTGMPVPWRIASCGQLFIGGAGTYLSDNHPLSWYPRA